MDERSNKNMRQRQKPKRDQRLEVRVNADELAAIDRFCRTAKVTRSEALRWVARPQRLPLIRITRNADLERIAAEANRIGVNVNQLTRKVNASADLADVDRIFLRIALGDMRKALDGIAREVAETRRVIVHNPKGGDDGNH